MNREDKGGNNGGGLESAEGSGPARRPVHAGPLLPRQAGDRGEARRHLGSNGDYELVRPADDEQELGAQRLLMDLALQAVRDPEAEPELPAPVAAIAKQPQI